MRPSLFIFVILMINYVNCVGYKLQEDINMYHDDNYTNYQNKYKIYDLNACNCQDPICMQSCLIFFDLVIYDYQLSFTMFTEISLQELISENNVIIKNNPSYGKFWNPAKK